MNTNDHRHSNVNTNNHPHSEARGSSEAPGKSNSASIRAEVRLAEIRSVAHTRYGVRFALDVYADDGGSIWLTKYSHYKDSEPGWQQFRREMKRLGLPLADSMDRNTVANRVKQHCRGMRVLVRIAKDGPHTSVTILKKA